MVFLPPKKKRRRIDSRIQDDSNLGFLRQGWKNLKDVWRKFAKSFLDVSLIDPCGSINYIVFFSFPQVTFMKKFHAYIS